MSRFTSVSKELQLAAIAALALAISMILPWYQKSVPQSGKIVQGNVSALGVFTFVEAAILLVALAVLFLVWARSQNKGFHLPGGDGVADCVGGRPLRESGDVAERLRERRERGRARRVAAARQDDRVPADSVAELGDEPGLPESR